MRAIFFHKIVQPIVTVSEIDEEINVINDKESKRKSNSKKKSSKKSIENKNKENEENKREIAESLETEKEKKEFEKKNHILGVFVHYADCLKLDFFVLHPVVKVSLKLLKYFRFKEPIGLESIQKFYQV